MLNSPSNPVGSIYSKEELTQIAKVLEGTQITVLVMKCMKNFAMMVLIL